MEFMRLISCCMATFALVLSIVNMAFLLRKLNKSRRENCRLMNENFSLRMKLAEYEVENGISD